MPESHPSPGDQVRIGIIGGSGLYALKGLEGAREVDVPTPFGNPSDALLVGRLAGREVALLARHGRRHTLLPGEINYRANIFALKSLGVERIISASAVGSMREEVRPREVVLIDQFIDRTFARASTFFGDGLVAHVSLADPVCPNLRRALVGCVERAGAAAHDGGVYLCMEGPAFSTRAESMLYRSWGVDVIGMTNVQEARLAREAEICYATMAMVTDYDCWHEEEEEVSVSGVLENLRANGETAARALREAVEALPEGRDGCACGEALRSAVLTRWEDVPRATLERLGPLVAKYL